MLDKIIAIKNIGKFVNFSSKSTADWNGNLNKLTLIYADNGYGKTTLAQIFKSLQTQNSDILIGRKTTFKTEKPSVNFRFTDKTIKFENNTWDNQFADLEIFDSFFTAENVYVAHRVESEHKKNIHSLILGKENIDCEKELIELDNKTRELATQLKITKLEIEKFIVAPLTFDRFIWLAQQQDLSFKIENQKQIIISIEQFDILIKKKPLNDINFKLLELIEIEKILALDFVRLSAIATQKVQAHIENTCNNNDNWLIEGLEYLIADSCPFCGADTKENQLIAAYRDFFSIEYKNHIRKINSTIEYFETLFHETELLKIQNLLIENKGLYGFWQNHIAYKVVIEYNTDLENAWNNFYLKLKTLFDQKKQNPLKSLSVSSDIIDIYTTLKSGVDQLHEYNQNVNEFNELINKKKNEIGEYKLDIEKDKLNIYENSLKRFDLKVNNLCEKWKEQDKLHKTIENDKKQKRENHKKRFETFVTSFAKYINGNLEKFTDDFKIVFEKPNFIGGKPNINYYIDLKGTKIELGSTKTDEKKASFKNTLSEGDKTTLAFAMFLATLISKRDELPKKVIVIDDPISSLDIHRISATTQRITSLVEKMNAQVIVLTHNLLFAQKLWQTSNIEILPLELSNENGSSILKKWDIEKQMLSEYLRDFHIVDSFAEKDEGDLLNVACALRRLLEGNLRLRFPKHFTSKEWLGQFIDKVRNAENSDSLFQLKTNGDFELLCELNDYSKEFHHSNQNLSSIINRKELKLKTKDAMKICVK